MVRVPLTFFNCLLCLTGTKGDRDSQKEVSLVYFSTFEPTNLTPDSAMQRVGMPMLYDSASNQLLPCHYNKSTSAQWQTSWGKHPWLHASLTATVTVISLFYIPSRTISVLEVPQLTRSEIGATTADSTRWKFGRGTTAGPGPGWPALMLKESGAIVAARAGLAWEQLSEEAKSGAARGGEEWTDSLWYHVWYHQCVLTQWPTTKTMISYVISTKQNTCLCWVYQ